MYVATIEYLNNRGQEAKTNEQSAVYISNKTDLETKSRSSNSE